MKKLTALFLALCLCFASCVMLASCDDDAPEHTHAYKTEWATDATHHWHVCEGEGCTEVADKAEHTWNAGEITTPATHDAQGVKTYTCTACAATKTEAVQGDFTVTAEEWEAAFNAAQKAAYLNSEFICKWQENEIDKINCYNNIIHGVRYVDGNVETDEYYDGDYIYVVEGDNVTKDYFYTLGLPYVSTYMSPQVVVFDFDDFAYDEQGASYKAAEITDTITYPGGARGIITYTNVEIVFLNGSLESLRYDEVDVYTDANGEEVDRISFQISATFGNASEIVIPSEWSAMEIPLGENDRLIYIVEFVDEEGWTYAVPFELDAVEIELPDGSKIPFTPGAKTVTLPDGTVSDVHLGRQTTLPVPEIPQDGPLVLVP